MKSVIAYLLFVGVPLVGLFYVFQAGGRLTAPRAVHGSYSTTVTSSGGCAASALRSGDSSIAVIQSGRRVTITVGAARELSLDGLSSDTAIAAEGIVREGVTPDDWHCQPGDTLRFTAAVDPGEQLLTLRGSLGGGCDSCAAVGFTASRPLGYTGHRRS